MKRAYQWVVLPERPCNVWVIEMRMDYDWAASSFYYPRAEARESRAHMIEYYETDPKRMRIRAYVPDPFLNRDRRVSR